MTTQTHLHPERGAAVFSFAGLDIGHGVLLCWLGLAESVPSVCQIRQQQADTNYNLLIYCYFINTQSRF